MRLRSFTAAGVAVLAALTLAGCRTNVGQAAEVDGHSISESQVNDYLTAQAKPISVQQSDGSTSSIPPRPFVLDILIERRFYAKLLAATPSKAPSDAQLSTLVHAYLKGQSADAAVRGLGAIGYTSAFNSIIVDVQVLATLLNAEEQQGVDVSTYATKLSFPVSVNPRYGSWDKSQLRLDYTPSAGLPSYLKLQTSPTSAP